MYNSEFLGPLVYDGLVWGRGEGGSGGGGKGGGGGDPEVIQNAFSECIFSSAFDLDIFTE